MESIEKLREKSLDYAPNIRRGVNMALDEIEREIAERYMEMPVDADGAPIHVGDEMIDRDSIPYIVTSVSAIRVYCKDGSWVYPSDCHHVKREVVSTE